MNKTYTHMNTNTFFYLISITILLFSCNNKKSPEKVNKKIPVMEAQSRNGDDPFLTKKYLGLNNSPMQEKLRNIKPFPVGVVYYQQRGDNLDSAKKEFRIIKDLGFTALKQVQLKSPDNPEWFRDSVFHAALDVGIAPWYYGRGGWQAIDQELLDRLGIEIPLTDENLSLIEDHPKMMAWQTQLMRKRIARMKEKPPKPKGMGEPGRNNPWMPERLIPSFALWLREEYETIENLKKAWNCGFISQCTFSTFQEAAKLLQGSGFDQFGNGVGKMSKDFRRFRDAMKFQSELIIENYRKTMELYTEWDPLEPERTGGHQIFENQAINTWDLEGQAKTASIGGSFYSSIHLCHHFFLVDGEITKPVYIQARIVADMFKGGWAATWESTGGPTFHSGYFPTTVDRNKIRQLMVSYIAAGLKGIGFWMWNSRGEGWETGEYALCDIQGKPSERATEAGKISRILQEQRFELWEAMDEPLVGILYSWENEAILGRLSLGAYPLNTQVYKTDWDKQFRQYHSQAKIGVSRALMNNHIPIEYLTERDLRAGLVHRYPVIFLPCVMALDEQDFDILFYYVKNGGRIVADMPLFIMDNYGRLNKQKKNSKFEQLFGFQIVDLFNTFNVPQELEQFSVEGYFGDLKITHAEVLQTFDSGKPAVISSVFGKGTCTVFNFEAGRMVFKPGKEKVETFIAANTVGNIEPPYSVKNAKTSVVFRRTAPLADHFFILNEGNEETIRITSNQYTYKKAEDILDKHELTHTGNNVRVNVPAGNAKWIRCIK
jgi:beta-galactosidase